MKNKAILVVMALAMVIGPAAATHETTTCSVTTTPPVVKIGSYYIDENLDVWEETNNLDGLQRQAQCGHNADTQVSLI